MSIIREYVKKLIENENELRKKLRMLKPEQLDAMIVWVIENQPEIKDDISSLDVLEIIATKYPNGIDGFLMDRGELDYESLIKMSLNNIKKEKEKEQLPPFSLKDFPLKNKNFLKPKAKPKSVKAHKKEKD